MTHFTCLVFCPAGVSPDDMLAPFQEGGGDNGEYTEFKAEFGEHEFPEKAQEILDKLFKSIEEKKKMLDLPDEELEEKATIPWRGETIQELRMRVLEEIDHQRENIDKVQGYIDSKDYKGLFAWWQGGLVDPDGSGAWGYLFNPNGSKWDWYQLGGRWTGLLKAKNSDAVGDLGSPGLGTRPCTDPDRYDVLSVKDVDWEYLRKNNKKATIKQWEEVSKVLKEKAGMTVRQFLALEREKQGEVVRNLDTDVFFFWEPKGRTKKEDGEIAYNDTISHSWITPDGKWHERSEMSWWATHGPEDKDAGKKFWEFVENVPGDTIVYLMDCHI